MDPESLANLPGKHGVHDAEPSSEYVPTPHRSQEEALVRENDPAGHKEQMVDPISCAILPGEHGVHDAEPTSEYVPKPHRSQEEAPVREKEPAGQREHSETPP